jgi:beta-lactamase superfamily II metal-dependent hydrolase
MSKFFRIEMLPAGHGDSLWIEYGDAEATRRILIDGGTVATYPYLMERLQQVPGNERHFELVVLTHVDADHIEGLVRVFADKPLPFTVGKVLFNGWRQMEPRHGLLGGLQGEFLSALLVNRVPRAWDAESPPVIIPDDGPLPVIKLRDGMTLTLLSPTLRKLQAMASEWKQNLEKVKLKPGDLDAALAILAQRKKFLPKEGLLGTSTDFDDQVQKAFRPDQAKANGSSLAFLAEYAGKSALLLADAHPDVIAQSLARLCAQRNVDALHVDAVKLSHHGSKNNTSEDLLARVRSPRYLISTSGAYFKHPDEECLRRVIAHGKPSEMVFNYDSEFTSPWIASAASHGYVAKVRADTEPSIRIEL